MVFYITSCEDIKMVLLLLVHTYTNNKLRIKREYFPCFVRAYFWFKRLFCSVYFTNHCILYIFDFFYGLIIKYVSQVAKIDCNKVPQSS